METDEVSIPQTVTGNPEEELIANAIQFARRGDRQRAHQLSVEATRKAPEDLRAWLLRAELAASPEENLFCLSQANALNPHNKAAVQRMYDALKDLLEKDPYLAYEDETEDFYRIRNSHFLSLAIPKGRGARTAAPTLDPQVERANRLLRWSIFGFLLSGLGSLVLAPLSALAAFIALRSPLDRANQVRADVILALAILIWLVSLPLSALFIMHILS